MERYPAPTLNNKEGSTVYSKQGGKIQEEGSVELQKNSGKKGKRSRP